MWTDDTSDFIFFYDGTCFRRPFGMTPLVVRGDGAAVLREWCQEGQKGPIQGGKNVPFTKAGMLADWLDEYPDMASNEALRVRACRYLRCCCRAQKRHPDTADY